MTSLDSTRWNLNALHASRTIRCVALNIQLGYPGNNEDDGSNALVRRNAHFRALIHFATNLPPTCGAFGIRLCILGVPSEEQMCAILSSFDWHQLAARLWVATSVDIIVCRMMCTPAMPLARVLNMVDLLSVILRDAFCQFASSLCTYYRVWCRRRAESILFFSFSSACLD